MNRWFVVALSYLVIQGCARIHKYNSAEAMAASKPKEVPWSVGFVVTLTQPISYEQAMEDIAKAGDRVGFDVILNDWKSNPFGFVKRDSMLFVFCDLTTPTTRTLNDLESPPVVRGNRLVYADGSSVRIVSRRMENDPRDFARYDFNFRPQTADDLVTSVKVNCGSHVMGLTNQISVSQERRYKGLQDVAGMYILELRDLWPTMQVSTVLPTAR